MCGTVFKASHLHCSALTLCQGPCKCAVEQQPSTRHAQRKKGAALLPRFCQGPCMCAVEQQPTLTPGTHRGKMDLKLINTRKKNHAVALLKQSISSPAIKALERYQSRQTPKARQHNNPEDQARQGCSACTSSSSCSIRKLCSNHHGISFPIYYLMDEEWHGKLFCKWLACDCCEKAPSKHHIK